MKVLELRKILAELNLETSGSKTELENRLSDHFKDRTYSAIDNGGHHSSPDESDSDGDNTDRGQEIVGSPSMNTAAPPDFSEAIQCGCVMQYEELKQDFVEFKHKVDSLCSSRDRMLDDYKSKCCMYEEKILHLEQEKANLLEVIKILSSELSAREAQSQTSSEQWQTVSSNKNQPAEQSSSKVSNQSKKKKKKNAKTSHSQENAERTQPQVISQPSPSSSASIEDAKTKRPVVVIVGDSLVKNVQGWKVSNSKRIKTVVKAFPGASVEDMFDYIKPTIKRHPEEIVLHVGTNDLKNSDSRKVAERIVDLGNFIEAESPETKVTISNLLLRTDDPALNSKTEQVNNILRTFAHQNDWNIISHSNVTRNHLNSSGLHLNLTGNKVFASNFVSYVRNI